jgi:hypothetical protein
MSRRGGNVTDFPAARIVDRRRVLVDMRFPELPWATRSAVMLLDIAKAAFMSERRGSRQRAAGMIDLAINQLVEAVATSKAVAREDLGKAMVASLGPDLTGGALAAIREMLAVLYHAMPDYSTKGDTDGDDGGSAA